MSSCLVKGVTTPENTAAGEGRPRRRRRRRRRSAASGDGSNTNAAAGEHPNSATGDDSKSELHPPRGGSPPAGNAANADGALSSGAGHGAQGAGGAGGARQKPTKGGAQQRKNKTRRGTPKKDGPNKDGPNKDRNGSKRRAQKADVSPAQLVKAVAKSATTKTAPKIATEKPLSQSEVAELKRHFQFLKDYRKQLKLKLNAQEDLLVNGAREPEHRGICQHLLAKVEYSRVVAAAERMAPNERVQLVEGVLRFSSELSFLLLYLESLKDAGHAGASSALSQALRRIDFGAVSEGQMRRVLDVIVELFGPQERPKLLLSLLESRSFQQAFDSALGKLPASLAELVTPLRAVHEYVLKKPGAPAAVESAPELNAAQLSLGVSALLEGGLQDLAKRHPAVRRRLLEIALRDFDPGTERLRTSVQELVDSFETQPELHYQLQLRLASSLIRFQHEARAEKLLTQIGQAQPSDSRAAQLLKALRAPKAGRYAVFKAKTGNSSSPLPPKTLHPLRPGFCLQREIDVWLRSAPLDQERTFRELLSRTPLLAGVVQPLPSNASGTPDSVFEGRLFENTVFEERGRVYIAYPRTGRSAATLLQDPTRVPLTKRTRLAARFVALLSSLAHCGLALPDASLTRFELSAELEPWLLETWDAEAVAVAQALKTALEAARLSLRVLLPEPDLAGALQGVQNLRELHLLLMSKSF